LDKIDKQKIILKKGAEATVYLAHWYGKEVVIKSRKVKKYRHPNLDDKLRKYRTIHEPQLMNEAKKVGVSTPIIFQIDIKKMSIIMEFISGKQIKHILSNLPLSKRRTLCLEIGKLIGKIHSYGIIHGDLTTSNIILDVNDRLFFIDFGLAEKQVELEARGVDLHLMKRGLQSTHNNYAQDSFRKIMEGYSIIMGESHAKVILKKIQEIERRGRYIEERKVK